jgi:hypothetical protein
MRNCTTCGHSLELNAKFCPNCGTAQPENNLENQASPLVGDKNVISTSGGDITGTKITGGNVSFTNIHHAQDDTKKRVRCFYTGQGVALEDLLNCPSCKKDVASSYFNLSNKRCYHCDDTAKNEYTQLIRDYLLDGRLDPTEIKELQMHQARLLLTDDETQNIERLEKERLAFVKTLDISEIDVRDIEDLAKLFEQNKHINQGDSIINVLYKKYPQSPEVSFYYFLNEFEKKDIKLYNLAISSREDNLFAYYFGGIAAELEGKTDESQKIIETLSLVYDEYFYLNDALKLLTLAEKFEYEPNNLISDKVIFLLNEIENSSIKGIYLSAYLGLIGFVDNYCCDGMHASLIAKYSNATSAALGYFFINIREKKLLAEKRKIEVQKQAEQERIELEKLEKKKSEEKAKVEALRIEQEKKEEAEEKKRHQKAQEEDKKRNEEERERRERLGQYERLADWQKPLNQHLLKSNKEVKAFKKLNIILIPIAVIGLGVFLFNIFKSNSEVEDLDAKLSKQYEVINGLILQNKLDSALTLVPSLVHPSHDCREYSEPNDCKYSYADYWEMKRSELTKKIDDKINP